MIKREWDVFICHASEDKDSFVRELALALQESDLKVWYDEFSLKLGDSLGRKIDEGLLNSRYGLIILSKHFFAKPWPQTELEGLVLRENSSGDKVILPIWHGVEKEEVMKYSPRLADKIACKSSEGTKRVIDMILEAVKTSSADIGSGTETERENIEKDSHDRLLIANAINNIAQRQKKIWKSGFTELEELAKTGLAINLDSWELMFDIVESNPKDKLDRLH
jgi:hypothetical protein